MKFSNVRLLLEARNVSFMTNFTSLKVNDLKEIAAGSAADRIVMAKYLGFNSSERSFNYQVADDLEYRVYLDNSGNPVGIFKGRK